jgi:hypothetical protein
MDDAAIIGIGAVVALVIGAVGYSFLTGPNSPLAQSWKKRLAELEVATRMGSPEDILVALRESGKLYMRLGKRWEAETMMRRAVQMSKQQYGEMNVGLIPILEDFARVMDHMNRKKEAEQLRKEAQRIKQKKVS